MKKDYISYWNEKGDYGKIRVQRMLERKAKRKTPGRRKTCDYCGETFFHEVPYRVDPFNEEINNCVHYARICDNCYSDLIADI